MMGKNRTEFILNAASNHANEVVKSPQFEWIEKNENGEWIYKSRAKLKVFLNYYLFTSTPGTPVYEWANDYGLPQKAISEAIILCERYDNDAYLRWVSLTERQFEDALQHLLDE